MVLEGTLHATRGGIQLSTQLWFTVATSYNNDGTIGAQMVWDICEMEHIPDTAQVGMNLKVDRPKIKPNIII